MLGYRERGIKVADGIKVVDQLTEIGDYPKLSR